LSTAKRVLARTLEVLRPQLRDGTPVVVLEPSCAAVFRSDLPDLLHGDEDAYRLAKQTRTIAELLHQRAPEWSPPRTGWQAVAQPHCHHEAILGYEPDAELLRSSGIDTNVLDAGCCGLAGNFGFERGHYDVSIACAEDKLMPAVREATPDTLVIADGFSCRTQIEHTSDTHVLHSAEALAAALSDRTPTPPRRPEAPTKAARAAALAGAAAAIALPILAVAIRQRNR
jgi:Fe-S oxidoreductase